MLIGTFPSVHLLLPMLYQARDYSRCRLINVNSDIISGNSNDSLICLNPIVPAILLWRKLFAHVKSNMIQFRTLVSGLLLIGCFTLWCVQFLNSSWGCCPWYGHQFKTYHLSYCFILACVATGINWLSTSCAVYELNDIITEEKKIKQILSKRASYAY